VQVLGPDWINYARAMLVRDSGFTLPSFLPFFTAFVFAMIVSLLFFTSGSLVSPYGCTDCNRIAKAKIRIWFCYHPENDELPLVNCYRREVGARACVEISRDQLIFSTLSRFERANQSCLDTKRRWFV
jgi:hypothetical protein